MPTSESTKPVKIKASQHESYGSYTLITLIIPIVGLILGIVFLTKSDKLDKKFGEHLVAFSILAGIVQAVLYWVFFAPKYTYIPYSY